MSSARIKTSSTIVPRSDAEYRKYLADKLRATGVTVIIQDEFAPDGKLTLDKLVPHIAACDIVIHLVGQMTGSPASGASVESVFPSLDGLSERVPFLSSPSQALALELSYTQWEAYLAHHFKKDLVICRARDDAPRGPRFRMDARQCQLQEEHLARLKLLKRHVEVEAFTNREAVAVELLRMLVSRQPQTPAAAQWNQELKNLATNVEIIQRLVTKLSTPTSQSSPLPSPTRAPPSPQLPDHEATRGLSVRNRQRMLSRVKEYWIDSVLHQAINEANLFNKRL